MSEQGPSLIDAITAGLAVLAVAEIAASQFAARRRANNRLVASLLLWEGIAMLGCAGVIYVRREIFDIATVVSLIAIWMAGAAIGLLRAGVFDPPPE